MTTPLYPIFEKRIHDATDLLLRQQIEPWVHFNSGHPVRVVGFDGRNIAYQGGGFEGSPRDVFWSRYIEPFIENLVVQEIAAAVKMACERKVDARLLLPEVQNLLLASSGKIFLRMVDIDQRLLGKGFPEKIPLRKIEHEIAGMQEFVEKHVRAELKMWRIKPWYEEWYERNKFWVWLGGILVTIVGLIAKFF